MRGQYCSSTCFFSIALEFQEDFIFFMYILLQDAAIHQFIINVNDDVNIKFAKFTLYLKNIYCYNFTLHLRNHCN